MVGGEEWGWMTGEGQENFVEHGDEGLTVIQYVSSQVARSCKPSVLLSKLAGNVVS